MSGENEDNESNELRRKLAETEARITSKILLVIEENLSQEEYDNILNKIKEKDSLDLLQLERDIASDATTISDGLQDIYKAVKEYRTSIARLNEIESGFWDPKTNKDVDPQMILNYSIICREKMFSLVDEYELKRQFIRHSRIQ